MYDERKFLSSHRVNNRTYGIFLDRTYFNVYLNSMFIYLPYLSLYNQYTCVFTEYLLFIFNNIIFIISTWE